MRGLSLDFVRWIAVLMGALVFTACAPEPRRVFRNVRSGELLRVPSGPGLVYQVAAVPGGPATCTLLALNEHGAVLARDAASGPLGLPKLRAPERTHSLKVELPDHAGDSGVSVYVNDPKSDRDGDGLGQALELALRTCDAPDQPGCKHALLRDYYQSVPHATRDTDRDGLPDGDELFGVKAPLDLPRYGVDPRHKDVLVEVDHSGRVEPPGIGADDLAAVAALFANGSAITLRNPDGKPGIALHFDAGFDPSDPKHASLFGDWGGSNQSSGKYRDDRKEHFTRERQRYFRYAVLVRSGLGQSSGDALVVNRDGNRVALLGHELAHTLGLKHEGHATWGPYNCKPNHRSIINYTYQNEPAIGFSTRRGQELNPSAVVERAYVPAAIAERLRKPPFELDASEAGIDWNRDGVLSTEPVRAPVTWATYKGCMASMTGQIQLAEVARKALPALVSAHGGVHVFWIDGAGDLATRRADIAPRCAGSKCATLADSATVPGLAALAHIAVAKLSEGRIALAHVSIEGALGVSVLELEGDAWQLRSSQTLATHATEDAPAIAVKGDALFVLYRMPDGRLVQARATNPGSPFELSQAIDHEQRPLFSAFAPSALVLGTGELCGAFPDLDAHIRLHCYEEPSGTWRDLSETAFYATLGPKTGGPVSLAYHRYRYADGRIASAAPICEADPARGALYMSFAEVPPSGDVAEMPSLLISTALDRDATARHAIDMRWHGNVGNQWTRVEPGTAAVLYEDTTLPGLVAVLPAPASGDTIRIELLPAADGTFDDTLESGNDFAVMERGICAGLRGDKVCGGAKTGAY